MKGRGFYLPYTRRLIAPSFRQTECVYLGTVSLNTSWGSRYKQLVTALGREFK